MRYQPIYMSVFASLLSRREGIWHIGIDYAALDYDPRYSIFGGLRNWAVLYLGIYNSHESRLNHWDMKTDMEFGEILNYFQHKLFVHVLFGWGVMIFSIKVYVWFYTAL